MPDHNISIQLETAGLHNPRLLTIIKILQSQQQQVVACNNLFDAETIATKDGAVTVNELATMDSHAAFACIISLLESLQNKQISPAYAEFSLRMLFAIRQHIIGCNELAYLINPQLILNQAFIAIAVAIEIGNLMVRIAVKGKLKYLFYDFCTARSLVYRQTNPKVSLQQRQLAEKVYSQLVRDFSWDAVKDIVLADTAKPIAATTSAPGVTPTAEPTSAPTPTTSTPTLAGIRRPGCH